MFETDIHKNIKLLDERMNGKINCKKKRIIAQKFKVRK
jgi:hypothetical protein